MSTAKDIGVAISEVINASAQPWVIGGWTSEFRWRPERPRKDSSDSVVVVTPVDYVFDEASRDRCRCPKVYEHHVLVMKRLGADTTGKEYGDPDEIDQLTTLAGQIGDEMFTVQRLSGEFAQDRVPQPAPFFNEFYLEQHRIFISAVACFYRSG